MAKINPDRRTQRTRTALKAAFVKLVLSHGYERLTAGEVCSEANVGRSTFYLHYASKEELLKESLKEPSSGIAACADEIVTPQQLAPLLNHFREQRIRNRLFFSDPIRSLWVKALAALIEPRLKQAARTSGMGSDLPRSFIALLVAEMQIALIAHWLTARSSLKPEVIAAALIANTRAMISGTYRSLM